MRMIIQARMPSEPFNTYVRDGTAGQKLHAIIEDIQPEMVIFSEEEGQRSAFMLVDMDDPSQVPSVAEPFFLTFDADVKFRIAMSPEDLARAGLEDLGTRYG